MRYSKTHITKEKEKEILFSGFSQENRNILFFYDENPNDYLSEIVSVQKIDENKYIVNPPYSYKELSEWLFLGNWQAISPVLSSFEFLDTFKTSLENILSHLAKHNVDLLIDSFHDNTEWHVFIKG